MTIEECPHYAAAIPRANRGGETGRLPPTSAVVPPVPTATAGGKKQLKKKHVDRGRIRSKRDLPQICMKDGVNGITHKRQTS